MKHTISIQGQDKKSLIKTMENLIRKINRETSMLKNSISESPNAHLSNEVSYHFASVPLLLRLSMLDLCILFKLHLKSNSVVEQNVLIRLICGHLYEFIEDVPTLFGKKYRKLLSRFPHSETLLNDLNDNVIKEFNYIKKNHTDFLKIIRHNVSHHKDIDALKQYYLINEIDFNWGIKAFMDIIQWYVAYSKFELRIIDTSMNAKK
jgi:hypothetical protein